MAWSKELQESWKAQHDIKKAYKECMVCGCSITKEDYNEYKMCSWCYSQAMFNPEEL